MFHSRTRKREHAKIAANCERTDEGYSLVPAYLGGISHQHLVGGLVSLIQSVGAGKGA